MAVVKFWPRLKQRSLAKKKEKKKNENGKKEERTHRVSTYFVCYVDASIYQSLACSSVASKEKTATVQTYPDDGAACLEALFPTCCMLPAAVVDIRALLRPPFTGYGTLRTTSFGWPVLELRGSKHRGEVKLNISQVSDRR